MLFKLEITNYANLLAPGKHADCDNASYVLGTCNEPDIQLSPAN